MAVSCEPNYKVSEEHWLPFLKVSLSVVLLKIFTGMMASGVAIVFSFTNLNFLLLINALCGMETNLRWAARALKLQEATAEVQDSQSTVCRATPVHRSRDSKSIGNLL